MMDREHPNIVLCTCDQMRAFEVGCYGNAYVHTPNIDALADQGTRFDLAVTNNPVCTPARSCMLSGEYSRTATGMLGNVHRNPPMPTRERLPDPTLPEMLRAADYRTALIGKWHIDPQPQLLGLDTALYPMVAHRHRGQTYFNERAESFRVDRFGPHWELEQVKEFLAGQRDAAQPFFLMYNISPPHQPIGPGHLPDEYTRMYDPDDVPLRINALDRMETERDRWWYSVYASAHFFWRDRRRQKQDPRDIVPDTFHLRDLVALYHGACTFVDDLFGALMSALETNGFGRNTVVLFTSDHGDNLGSHGMFNKRRLDRGVHPYSVHRQRSPARECREREPGGGPDRRHAHASRPGRLRSARERPGSEPRAVARWETNGIGAERGIRRNQRDDRDSHAEPSVRSALQRRSARAAERPRLVL